MFFTAVTGEKVWAQFKKGEISQQAKHFFQNPDQ